MIIDTQKQEAKPWFKSKIVLLGIATVLLFGGGFLESFISIQGVTPEMMEVLESQMPVIYKAIQDIQGGASVFSVVGTLIGTLIVIIRVWFTQTAKLTIF